MGGAGRSTLRFCDMAMGGVVYSVRAWHAGGGWKAVCCLGYAARDQGRLDTSMVCVLCCMSVCYGSHESLRIIPNNVLLLRLTFHKSY